MTAALIIFGFAIYFGIGAGVSWLVLKYKGEAWNLDETEATLILIIWGLIPVIALVFGPLIWVGIKIADSVERRSDG